MFNKTKNKLNSLQNIEMKPEYKEFGRFALVYATRYCLRHRKELTTQEDVKKCFDEGLKKYKQQKLDKQNKLIDKEVENA